MRLLAPVLRARRPMPWRVVLILALVVVVGGMVSDLSRGGTWTPDTTSRPPMDPLRRIKLTHTAIWAFFVACILAIPLFTLLSRLRLAALFGALVGVEVVILVVNRMACPLTAVAARYTDDRRANFDIYLPEWLARHNKSVFGVLYVGGLLLLLGRWLALR